MVVGLYDTHSVECHFSLSTKIVKQFVFLVKVYGLLTYVFKFMKQ